MTTSLAEQIQSAVAGDQAAFAELCERHRHELHVHCYRMLASVDDADDAVQESFLRAWRTREDFDGSNFRAWLYRIATNVSIDLIRKRRREARDAETSRDVPWLQPYPDSLLDEVRDPDAPPDTVAVDRETISLVFLVALQVLPPRQRAALVARDVLGWPARETASVLETSVAAANSALERARTTMRAHLQKSRNEWTEPATGEHERRLLSQFIDAHERGDTSLAVSIAAQDLRITMPPFPMLYVGLDAMRPLLDQAMAMGEWRLLPTSANRLPAAASYLRRADDTRFRAFKLDVIRAEGDRIAEITTFGPNLFGRFGLPEVLDS